LFVIHSSSFTPLVDTWLFTFFYTWRDFGWQSR